MHMINSRFIFILIALLFIWGSQSHALTGSDNISKKNAYSRVQSSKKVRLYMTSWCPYCQKMEQYLIASKIPYSKLDIENNAMANKQYRELGGDGVPFVVVNETVINGYDPEAVKEAWDEWNKD